MLILVRSVDRQSLAHKPKLLEVVLEAFACAHSIPKSVDGPPPQPYGMLAIPAYRFYVYRFRGISALAT